jgi:hypothetical protein
MRARNAVAITAAALAIAGAVAIPAQADVRGDPISATVAPGSQVAPHGRWYLLNANPGTAITQSVRIINPNPHDDSVIVEPVDAFTSDKTGAGYGAPGSPKAVVARWIVVSVPQLTIRPGETRDVPFTVHVPKNIGPGQYLAYISAVVPISQGSHHASPNHASFEMDVQLPRVVAVEIDVPGPRAPHLVVTGAEPLVRPNGIVLGVHIANQGNAFAHGKGVIRVADTNTDYSFPIDTFVSETSIVYPMPWTQKVVPGLHHIQVDLTYEGGRRTSWSGTVNIAGDLQNQLENGLKNVQIRSGSSSSALWLVLAALLLLGLIGATITVRRRNRRPHVNYRPV